MNIFIRPNGNAQCLYSENINLATLGAIDIKRASHVEPDPANPGNWLADLSPVDGPTLGPFKSRGDALAAEAKWLDDKLETRDLRGPFDHM